jgi:hypothetical protein
MTKWKRRSDRRLIRALQFLLDEFVYVPDRAPRVSVGSLKEFQARSARRLLPGPLTGAFSRQQKGLVSLDAEAFTQLRHDVQDWLERLFIWSPAEQAGDPPIVGPRISVSPVARRRRELLVEGAAVDVFWFYVVWLVAQVGLDAIAVCPAPRVRGVVPCLRLFVRRGRRKIYCSERCRARVATQRARGIVHAEL